MNYDNDLFGSYSKYGKFQDRNGETQSFLSIIETEDGYFEFIGKEGLLVLDVYSGWCGPCFSMIKYLREVFMDYFLSRRIDDPILLHFGLCKVDCVRELDQFANNSMPTWIFMKNKKIIEVIYGSNPIHLMKFIRDVKAKTDEADKKM